MTKQEILEKVKKVVSEKTGMDVQKLDLATRFKEDLAADSLVKYDIVVQLEETFEISIPDEDTEPIKTIGTAVEYLERRLR